MSDLIFLINTALMYATPLILVALGGLLTEKSGIINIALEGLMTFGAFIATLIALKLNRIDLAILGSMLSGAILSLLHAFASIHLKGNQVVSGMAINFLGPGLSLFLCRIFFEGSSMTPSVPSEFKIPNILGQNLTVYLAFFITFLLWFIFEKTVVGLRIRSIGENPEAARSLGINPIKYQYACTLVGGALAGLGGASLSIAIVSNFRPTLVSGQGFIALAAVIFGKWRPIGTLFACLFFGLSQGFVIFVGGNEFLQQYFSIPAPLLALLPYVLTLFILIKFSGKSAAPLALGKSVN